VYLYLLSPLASAWRVEETDIFSTLAVHGWGMEGNMKKEVFLLSYLADKMT
jgi:hypothetical protein